GVKSISNSVRVVHLPRPCEDDPDADSLVSGSTTVDYITYGGLKSSSEVYVDAAGKEGYVPTPLDSYNGVRVDQHYVWVFDSSASACATQASVVRCLNGKSERPRWICHSPTDLLYTAAFHQHQHEVTRRRPLLGLVDLCPCDDGTLIAALYTRSAE